MANYNNPSPHSLHITVNRTPMGTLCEGVTALLLLAMWVWAILVILRPRSLCEGKNPLIVTQLTDYALTQTVFICIISTCICAYLLAAAYHPLERLHMPMRLTSATQLVAMMHYARSMAINLAALFLCITLGSSSARLDTIANIGCMVCIAAMAVNVLACLVRAYRRRDRRLRTYWTFR